MWGANIELAVVTGRLAGRKELRSNVEHLYVGQGEPKMRVLHK
jgi:hypothetical protein